MLCELPNELLLQIFHNLVVLQYDHHSPIPISLDRPRIHGLASICSSCARLRSIAEPVLYSTFVWRDAIAQSEGDDDEDQTLQPNHRLRSFLRSIIRRPELADHVRYMALRQFNHPGQLATYFNSDLTVPDRDLARLYQETSSQISLGKLQDSWRCALRAGDSTAEVTLLDCLLSNVKDVNILFPAWSPTTTPPFYMAHLQQATNPRIANGPRFGIFNLIERLTVSNWTSEKMATGIPLWCLSELMRLPTLRRVHFIGAREGEDLTGWTCAHRSSNVSDVDLTNSFVGAAGLELFISSCAALRIFSMRYTHHTDFSHFGERDVDWQGVGDALREQRHTLQDLTLDAEDQSPTKIASWMIYPQPIGSLQDFAVLKTICIHQWILLGRDSWYQVQGTERQHVNLAHILPQCLVELKILQCTLEIIPQLQTLHNAVLEDEFREFAAIHVDWDPRHAKAVQTSSLGFKIESLAHGFVGKGVNWDDSNGRVFQTDTSMSKYNPTGDL